MNIAVIGVGQTPCGELWNKSLANLLAEAQCAALDDANISPGDIDEIYTANMCGNSLNNQLHLSALASETLNISVPSTRIEAACASGGVALRAGIMALESGRAQTVLVNGVEKMTDADSSAITTTLMGAADQETEQFVGATFPALFAIITRMYLQQHNITREHLAMVSIKNHRHAYNNPLAHLQKEISLPTVLSAPMVADPLSLFDCAPVSDGAASLILTTPQNAQRLGKKPVFIIASSQASDTLSFANRPSFTEFAATQKAAQSAFTQANLSPKDINVIELHDAFTMAEIMALENMGFYAPGTAAHATQKNQTTYGGQHVVNPSGGLKAHGHPVGATGIFQAVEIVLHLRGDAGKRQVTNARYGLTHNMGGLGGTVVVHIFSNRE